MKEKIYEIGEKLNISEKDINLVKNSDGKPSKGTIQWILSALVSAISFIIGFFMGRSQVLTSGSTQGYPFAAGLTVAIDSSERLDIQDIQRIRAILVIVLPIITFLLGTILGVKLDPSPSYTGNIRYGVYKKEDRATSPFKFFS